MDVQSVPSSSLSVAPSSVSNQSGGSLSGSSQMGAGQDFVLFDDAGNSSGLASMSPPRNKVDNNNYYQSNSPIKMNDRPPFTSTPSFTEHRGHQSGIQMESPFSSPASKPDEDFGISTSATSEANSHGNLEGGSGTLAHGTPKSKRQRGHGYSSSWTGGNLQQHRQNQSKYSSNSTLANAMAPTQSFGGYSGSLGQRSDYAGSDTSPQNPPSGNFGPPIQSLSLGEGSDGSFPTLFPNAVNSDTPTIKKGNSIGSSSSSTLDGALPFSSFTPRLKQHGQSSSQSTILQKDQRDLDERARQQIRAELMGVDSRALKGPLRDIQQGTSQDDNQQSLLSNLSFNAFQPSNFFAEPQQQSDASTSGRPGGLIRQRSGSLDESFLSSNQNSFNAGSNWSGLPTNDFNAFDLQGLDIYRTQFSFPSTQQQQTYNPQYGPQNLYNNSNNYHNNSFPSFSNTTSKSSNARPNLQGPQLSARTQQAVDRARAQKPTRKRMIGDGSGLTISPQDAFLDYDNIEPLLQQSSQTQLMSTNDQSLFKPPPLGLQEMLSSSESAVLTPKATSSSDISSFPNTFGPSSVMSTTTHEGTPSLVDANSSSSSNNESRATSIISSPVQRMPLNREDTVRPKKQQMNDSSSQQSINTTDLFSPAYSTSSSTDDEDEKPYKPDSLGGEKDQSGKHGVPDSNDSPRGKWQFPFPSQASKDQVSSMTRGIYSGPRFSAVSSSSSESDDDDQRGRKNQGKSSYDLHGRRTMGGYGYMGSSQESGMSVTNPYFTPANNKSMQAPSSMPSSQNSSSSPMYPGSGASSQRGMISSLNQKDNQTPQSAGGQSDSQSLDEGPKLSPSIRTSAQAIVPADSSRNVAGGHLGSQINHSNTQGSTMNNAHNQSRIRSQAQAAAISAASMAAANANRSSSEKGNSSVESNSEWETGDDSEADGSDYQEEKQNTTKKSKSNGTRKRRRDGGGTTTITRSGGTTRSGALSSSTTSSHLTVCDYISPLTGEACRTEFHRPYDLARHRETIHAREEALLVKQGRLRKEQCVVLYREVDPAKSLATVEWKCEGKNGCGSLFSRKDALLRHKRIRGH